MKNIIFQRSDNVLKAENLPIKEFIGVGSQGSDNPFEFIRRIPHVERVLFTEGNVYLPEYYLDSSACSKGTKPFKQEFEECVKVAKNLNTLIMFHERYEGEEPLEPPAGWSVAIKPAVGPKRFAWVIYTKC